MTHRWRSSGGRLGRPWGRGLGVSSGGGRGGPGRQHDISAPQGAWSAPHPRTRKSILPAPPPWLRATRGMGKRMGKTAPSRGILGNLFMLISTNFWSLIPLLRKRRKTPDHGTSFIKIHVNEEAQTRIQDAGRTRGCKETPRPAPQCWCRCKTLSQPHGRILPPHCPRRHRAATHSNAAREFMRKETFICLSSHRFEFIPRQGLAFRKCIIKEFVSSFLNQILVHLPAALLLVMLQPFCSYTNMLRGKIPIITPWSCTVPHVHTHAQKLLLPAQLFPLNVWCR